MCASTAVFKACNLTPNMPQFRSTRSISGAAVVAHTPPADFPSPSKCLAVNHQWGFAFHFPSALDCVTKPPDSSPLTKMFYNTADQIETTDKPHNKENKRHSQAPIPAEAWGAGIKSTFSSALLKCEIKRKTW